LFVELFDFLGEKIEMKDFRDLKVWEKAHALALACYQITAGFPKHEIFGIVSQIRRSGSSVAANIAEGCGRGGNAEFQRFLHIAMGSASELEYHLLLSKDLLFLEQEDHDRARAQVVEVKRMLAALIRKIDSERR
jgi:four helix bundle protein